MAAKVDGMKCVDAQRQMRAYLDGSLPDKQTEQFIEHVAGCRDCREDLELFLTIRDTLSDTAEDADFPMGVDKHLERARSGLHRRKLQRFALYVLVALALLMLVGLMINMR